MICPRCHSENVQIQAVTDVHTAHHGVLWWLLLGWWWVPIKWIFFFLPALLLKLFGKSRVKSTVRSMAVCQNCGNRWTVA